MMDHFVSQRDLNQLIEKSIDVENLKFAILHGLSDNRFKRLDISDARELVGYQPQDDLTDVQPQLKRLKLSRKVRAASLRDGGEKSGLRNELRRLKQQPLLSWLSTRWLGRSSAPWRFHFFLIYVHLISSVAK